MQQKAETKKPARKAASTKPTTAKQLKHESDASRLLGDKITVFSNPYLTGKSPIPPKSVGEVVQQGGESSESVIRVTRSQQEMDHRLAGQGSSDSLPQGSVRPSHDQEIPRDLLFSSVADRSTSPPPTMDPFMDRLDTISMNQKHQTVQIDNMKERLHTTDSRIDTISAVQLRKKDQDVTELQQEVQIHKEKLADLQKKQEVTDKLLVELQTRIDRLEGAGAVVGRLEGLSFEVLTGAFAQAKMERMAYEEEYRRQEVARMFQRPNPSPMEIPSEPSRPVVESPPLSSTQAPIESGEPSEKELTSTRKIAPLQGSKLAPASQNSNPEANSGQLLGFNTGTSSTGTNTPAWALRLSFGLNQPPNVIRHVSTLGNMTSPPRGLPSSSSSRR